MAHVTDRLAHWSAGPVAPSFTPHRGPVAADEPTPARASRRAKSSQIGVYKVVYVSAFSLPYVEGAGPSFARP